MHRQAYVARHLAPYRLRCLRAYVQQCTWFCSSALSVQQLQRRFGRLKSLHGQLQVLGPIRLAAYGFEYNLPVHGTVHSYQDDHVPQTEVDYLAGFFDGDGCVVSGSSCLAISQVADRGEALLRFVSNLGGSIYADKKGVGAQKATVRWQLYGIGARQAAKMLATASLIKHSQLVIASSCSPACASSRQKRQLDLRRLKREPHPAGQLSSWSYFAGFFDADGHIHLRADSAAVKLAVTQKHRESLDAIRELVSREFASRSYVRRTGSCYVWMSSSDSLSRAVLQRLLSAGLVVKRGVALLALSTSREDHFEARERIASLLGNQSKYRRLDSKGCARAAMIASLRQKLVYRKQRRDAASDDFLSMDAELNRLRLEHSRSSLAASVALMRRDIRTLLCQGAVRLSTNFDAAMADDEADDMLDYLEISLSNKKRLFDILDSDGDGLLNLHEIVDGIMRLRGPADKSDVVSNGLMIRAMQKSFTEMKRSIDQLKGEWQPSPKALSSSGTHTFPIHRNRQHRSPRQVQTNSSSSPNVAKFTQL